MTLSFARAVQHGGLFSMGSSVTDVDEDVVSHAFLVSGTLIVTVGGFCAETLKSGEAVADISGVSTGDNGGVATPVMVSGADHAGDFIFLAEAVPSGGGIVLNFTESTIGEVFGLFSTLGARGDVIKSMATARSSMRVSIPSVKHLSNPTKMSALKAINESMLGGFICSEIVSNAGRDSGPTDGVTTIYVPPGSIVDETLTAKSENLPSAVFQYAANEDPGTPFKWTMMVEYNDAKTLRKKDGLKLKDVCGRSKSTTCLGGDEPCDYDNYVFARATGRCRGCAKQDSVRDKFSITF